jgi:hypothetical protein
MRRDALPAASPATQMLSKFSQQSCQRTTQPLAYLFVAIATLLIVISSHVIGLTFVRSDNQALAIALMAALVLIYRRRQPTMQIADLASYGILWAAFMLLGAMLTYIVASSARPLADTTFVLWDSALGFDWLAWKVYVENHPYIENAFSVVYPTIFPQILAAMIYFSMTRRPDRNDELWWSAVLTLLVTTIGFGFFPGLGAGASFDRLEVPMTTYLPDLLTLRDASGLHNFTVMNMQGIITMPSYHAVLAVIITTVLRGIPRLFWPAVLFNGFMLFSLPTHGSHYLVDVIAGVFVALICSWIVRRSLKALRGIAA